MVKIGKFLKSKPVTVGFAFVSLIAGFLFLNYGLTGNVVLNNKVGFSLLPLIGLLLILCAVILTNYSVRKK